jgi:hypothetical protein
VIVAATPAAGQAALALTPGTDVQAFDSDLGTLAAASDTGIQVRTGSGTSARRTITGSKGITVTNGNGVSAAPALTIANRVIASNIKVVLPATSAASLGLRAGGSSPAESFQTYDFGDTSDSCIDVAGVIAVDGLDASTNVTPHFSWAAATATAGAVVWRGGFRNLVGDDLDSSNTYADQTTAAITTNGTAGILTTTTIVYTSSQIDGITAGSPFIYRLCRDADNGSDGMVGNAQLLESSIYFTEG